MSAPRSTGGAAPAACAVGSLVLVALAGCAGTPEPVAEVEPGPLDQMAELLSVGDDTAELRIQERVSACMAEAGFEYVPVRQGPSYEGVEPPEEMGTRAYAERFGYGLTTDPNGIAAAHRAWFDAGGAALDVDPNVALVEAMSEAERAQYVLALWGTATEDDDPADWELGGCQGRARHEVEVAESSLGPGRETYLRGARETWAATYADPRVADAAAEWSACMADAGYPDLATPESAPASAEARVATATDEAAVAELRPWEIELAVADHDCQSEVGYRHTLASVLAEYQREFYAANRTELDALWDAARELDAAGDREARDE